MAKLKAKFKGNADLAEKAKSAGLPAWLMIVLQSLLSSFGAPVIAALIAWLQSLLSPPAPVPAQGKACPCDGDQLAEVQCVICCTAHALASAICLRESLNCPDPCPCPPDPPDNG